MRAIYLPFEKTTLGKSLLVRDEQAKHLQVVRIRQGEEVLILNGKGDKAFTKVETITKNEVELIVEKTESGKRLHDFHLAIANPKKDAFEDILKIAVELGVKSIQPLSSSFSQYEFESGDRVNRILENALVQSNNLFLPEILPQISLQNFLETHNSPLYFFNSRPDKESVPKVASGDKTVLIGPEGGFSEQEVENIGRYSQVFSIHLPTPIQRAPTAVASSIGYLLALGARS